MIVLLVKAVLKNETDRNVMLGELVKMIPATLREPGVMAFNCAADVEDPQVIRAVEVFESEAAIIAHVEASHTVAMFGATAGLNADVSVQGFQGDMVPFSLEALFASRATADGLPGRFSDS